MCLSLLTIPVGIIILLLRIMYYRLAGENLQSGANMQNTTPNQSIMHVLVNNYTTVLIILTILGLIAMIITGALFLRGILHPIRQLTKAASEIERGNLDFAITYDKKDEFSQVFTQFDRMRTKLKDSLWQQIRDEESRTEMIANIAHDLRTPITSIQGYAQGLIDDIANTEEKKQKYLKTIIDKSQELNRMSDSLSTFANVDKNSVKIEKTKTNAKLFIENEIDDMKMGFQTAQITHKINLQETTHLDIDIMQVKRVFANIVQNSIKYKGSNSAQIHIYAYENDKYVLFRFTDQGLGVKNSELKLIFNRFYRSDSARQDTNNGSGLGLSIAKQIVLLHKGYIWARQNTPKGLQIFVSFPKIKGN